MESGDENEMVERFRGHSLSLRNDKGPVWDGRCSAFRSYWYDMYVFLKCCNDGKLVKTVDGEDREDRLAADESVRNAYARRNLLVWRYMIRSIDKQCRTSKAVRLMIIDDFQEGAARPGAYMCPPRNCACCLLGGVGMSKTSRAARCSRGSVQGVLAALPPASLDHPRPAVRHPGAH